MFLFLFLLLIVSFVSFEHRTVADRVPTLDLNTNDGLYICILASIIPCT